MSGMSLTSHVVHVYAEGCPYQELPKQQRIAAMHFPMTVISRTGWITIEGKEKRPHIILALFY